jgi:hypothetical protein
LRSTGQFTTHFFVRKKNIFLFFFKFEEPTQKDAHGMEARQSLL